MQIEKKETTNPFGKTSEVGYFKLQNDGYLALNNTIAGIFSIYAKCTSTGTINIGSDERTISTDWMRYIFYKIPLNCQVLFTQGEYFIYGAKLESGNKVTDWTAAPEDIQNQFTIITNTISGVSSKVDNVEKSIVNKVWQTDITSKINEYNNTTVKEIVDRVTKTETDINGVTTTVSTMKTNYDGQITSLETKQIQTDSKLGWLVSSGTSSSDFTLTDRTAELVSKYINLHGLVTFKGLSSDVNGKFTKYDGWGGTTDSTKINGAMIETGSIKAEQIAANAITATKIAANAVTADKISAYGLSVLHKTTGEKTLEIDASGNVNLNVNSLQIASKDVPTKTEVTQSIKDLQIGGRNLFLKTGIEISNNDYNMAMYRPASKPLSAGEIYTATLCVTPAKNVSYFSLYFSSGSLPTVDFYVDGVNRQIISETFTMDYAKDMTPDKNIDYANASLYRFPNDGTVTENSTIHWIKIEKGNKATDWTPAPEDLTADVQAKADEALASAKTYADTQIKVTADSINQNVTKKFDDLQIGGRNLIIGTSSADVNDNWKKIRGWGGGSFKTYDSENRIYKMIAINGWSCWDYTALAEYVSQKVTISFKAKNIKDETTADVRYGLFIMNSDKYDPLDLTSSKPKQDEWINLEKTVTLNTSGKIAIGTYCSTEGKSYKSTWLIKDLKLEKGNKATDWTPAPEDLATADNVNDKLAEVRKEINSNIEQTGEAIKSSVYEKVYLKDDVDTLLSSVNTEVEQTKTSWQVTFNQLVNQLNDYSDGSDAAFDEIRKYIRFEDGNILLGNSSSPLILCIRNDQIQFLQNGYEVAYISDQKMYNTTCEIINQLRIADSAWTVEYNASGDTVISLVGI